MTDLQKKCRIRVSAMDLNTSSGLAKVSVEFPWQNTTAKEANALKEKQTNKPTSKNIDDNDERNELVGEDHVWQ